jgi:hypothetical protein
MMRIAAAASTVVLWPASAIAAGELGLSNDGVTWSASLPSPLFDSTYRWVPGDRQQRSFWVRNQSSDKAVLDVTVLGSSVDSLMDTGDLEVEVRAGTGPWHSTRQAGRHKLISSTDVSVGQQEKITVAVDFDFASANVSQVKKFNLVFEIRLTQDTSGINGGTHHDGNGGNGSNGHHHQNRNDDLPGTGGLPWWVLPLGVGLTGGGIAVVTGTRKERTDG